MLQKEEFSELLLNVAFSVMACDGEIDDDEVKLILKLDKEEKLFHFDDLKSILNDLVNKINIEGQKFFSTFFDRLKNSDLSHEQEVQIVDIAIRMIQADDVIMYNELKFFKIIFNYLKITEKQVLDIFSNVEDIEDYVVKDVVSENYLEKITSDYFKSQEIGQFDLIKNLDDLKKKS